MQEDFSRGHSDWALLGESAVVRQLRLQIQRVAPHFRTALIRGEAVSGKQAVAQAIHKLSPGAQGKFVVIDAPALADAVELGDGDAKSPALAVIEAARGGTLYLKHTGELSFRQQTALLHLVRGRVTTHTERNGFASRGTGRTIVPTPCLRILAGSDRDLRALAAAGQFRGDLCACLSAVELQVPPLRERVDDIPLLGELLLRRLADTTGQTSKAFAEPALRLLQEHPWPGNLGELERVVAEAAALAEGGVIEPLHLTLVSEGGSARPSQTPPLEIERLHDVVQRHVLEVLARCGGNKLRAAELLGISRSTLYRMLEQTR